jgi:hypothetical protein
MNGEQQHGIKRIYCDIMANSSKQERDERVWDDPIISENKIPFAGSSKHLLESQTKFLQENPESIYRYLKEMHINNQKVRGYSIGFMFICTAVAITLLPLLFTEITNQDITSTLMLVGIGMFIISAFMARLQQ